jgi:Family of unknown function (DUF5319)
MSPQDDERFDEEPLDEAEREMLRQDLLDVEMLKELLAPRDIKGVVFYCPDCEEEHFLGWDLFKGNLQELLNEGQSPVHEPAFDPNPDDYVTWDYARGFLDGYETLREEDFDSVIWQLVDELHQRGWPSGQVIELLTALGVDDASKWLDQPMRDNPGS